MVSFSTSDSTISNPVYQRMTTVLNEQFSPIHLDVQDDSHKHASHAAMKDNTNRETHFTVTIVSERFQEISIVERHRLVNDALAKEMDES